ncbi:MAG: squalene/phytoene synthase family protein [Solirubrobacterales bacterium]|nr:squalene/phytoene synthase family protein [Solirubrobacterales bacterium]
MNAPAIEIERAHEACDEITRHAAANFYYGIRLLPRPKRQAMSAVYAFARRVDDIGDSNLDPDTALSLLAAERTRLGGLADEAGDGWNDVRLPEAGELDPVILALAHARRQYDLPLKALELLIDGVELDVRGARYETFDELVDYCRAVAGSIGRLCLAIFTDGHANGASQLADDLGVAMQLTNILRDIREDQARGRVYLPGEDLRRFDCGDFGPAGDGRAAEMIRFEAQRAQDWFERGLRLVDELEPRSAACVLAMTGIYRSILERIVREPDQVLRRRISLRPWEKTWVAARSLVGARI